MAYLQVETLTKSFGEKYLFEDITFFINENEKVSLIAKNGAGKTTLLNILTQKIPQDEGKVSFNKGISVTYLPQEPDFDPRKTLIEQVFDSSDFVVRAVKDYEKAMISGNEDLIEKAVSEMDRLEAWNYEQKIKQILEKLKITNLNKPVGELSGGQKKRLALANALINTPNFLILDEPTNHLDFEMIEWLEEYLAKTKLTLLFVTHDRYFLDKISTKILEIDENKIFTYKGNYSYYLQKRQERIELQNTEIAKAQNLLKKEAEWMNRMPQARATKAKYRIDNFHKIKEEANKRVNNSEVDINVKTSRLGKKVIDIYNISKSFDNKLLIDDFSYKFVRLEKIGVVGNNGTGKSTLLNIITENIKPDNGYFEVGETVKIAYYKQSGINLKDDMRIIDVVKEIAEVVQSGGGNTMSAAQFLEYFLFPRTTHYKYVSTLSGGEKRRLYLLTILMQNPNFLILDEPTNDLDIMTLNVLEEYLQNFPGNVLVVSHDRYFMDKVADTLFVFNDTGKISHFPGNYSQYLIHKKNNKVIIKKPKTEKTKRPKQEKTNKLSYKEKREFDELEIELEKLNLEKSELEERLNSGKIPIEELPEKSKYFSELIEIIDEKEFRWLELSEKI